MVKGNVDNVILVLAPRGLAFRGEHADHRERELPDAHDLAHGVDIAEKVVHHGLSQEADLGGSLHVRLNDSPTLDNRPIPDEKDFRCTGKSDGGPVLISKDNLSNALEDRGGIFYRR